MDKQVEKLHQIQMYGRWLFVLICWLTLAPIGIWGLREEIALIAEHFTWTAVIYGISYNFLPSLALTFSIAITIAVLVRQTKYKLTGISPRERLQLEKKVEKINNFGSSHPLWKWIVK
jgi:hypothetical protein